MILKRHSLATKLFVAFLCSSIFIILVMMALIGFQMRSGFSDYLLRVELQSFDDVAKSVAYDGRELAFADDADVFDRVIDTHIKNIRTKLRKEAPGVDVIRSVYGVGYAYEEQEL